jgi:hypothetical protein
MARSSRALQSESIMRPMLLTQRPVARHSSFTVRKRAPSHTSSRPAFRRLINEDLLERYVIDHPSSHEEPAGDSDRRRLRELHKDGLYLSMNAFRTVPLLVRAPPLRERVAASNGRTVAPYPVRRSAPRVSTDRRASRIMENPMWGHPYTRSQPFPETPGKKKDGPEVRTRPGGVARA